MLVYIGRDKKGIRPRTRQLDAIRKRGIILNCDHIPIYTHGYLDRTATVVPRTFEESKLYSTKRVRPVRYVRAGQN